ncbi:sigma-70 family RNA polymerase sigma factor [uncultured Enterovirga sp.]|uniref:sigma-70 family RNA polymerase sigma factor n=1 Tax=uncultured Enterovirga sp. TaxID=2026352 RepID=UPI0035CA9CD7
MPPSPDLAQLIAATARGERAAFERLYGLTAAKLLGVAFRIVRDRSVAEDVVQDSYLKIWQGAGSYSVEAGRPMTWLITIARNRAIDVVRRRREVAAPETEDGFDWLEGVPEPRDRETEFLDADRLTVCLGRLEATHRRCLLEAYYMGYSREELSERFARPVNTIKTWLHRSAHALRACLGET